MNDIRQAKEQVLRRKYRCKKIVKRRRRMKDRPLELLKVH